MKAGRLGLPAALGLGFGFATSLANDLGLKEGFLGTAARVVSIVLDAGWAWAALAVVAGALAVATAAAAVASTLSPRHGRRLLRDGLDASAAIAIRFVLVRPLRVSTDASPAPPATEGR